MISRQLHAAVVAVLNTQPVKERFLNSGMETVGSTPEKFAEVIRADVAPMRRVIRAAGIRVN